MAFSHRHGRDSCGCGIVVFIFERLQDVARLLEADILRCKHITECVAMTLGQGVFGIAVVRTECKIVIVSESQSLGLLKLCERIPNNYQHILKELVNLRGVTLISSTTQK